ncbi:hypothetical protein ABB26_09935 [Stenotrophomonas humi]|uniref:Uncharacterized protein n=1 Tax=Stenotrophomonas humi TaxID=405444 RepID=A0A0R0C3U3_9GAMM|nr:hypothetical protein [Stenotrophomonas humi]KRG63894.1 hypothetical protein ABB26_09935 [Stenotrophomonas humi]
MEDTNMWGVGSGLGVLFLLGKMAWDRFLSPEAKANDRLIGQLGERIASQEARLVTLETGLDEERKARREAETKVYELTMRIMRLEFELKKHNIEVPQ